MSDISTLTLVGNATRGPIGNALTKEKFTNDIENAIHHQKTLSSFNKPRATRCGARARKTRAPRDVGRTRR